MSSFIFKNVYLDGNYSIVGPLEKLTKLKKFDLALDDYYFGEKTFENAEIKMQSIAINNLIFKKGLQNNDIDFLIGGDLLNQISATSYSAQNFKIPVLGIYSACASFIEGLIIGSEFVDNNQAKNVLVVTSSHNLTAERQFRYPVEYGALKKKTSTFTVTGSVSTILTKRKTDLRVVEATIGRIVNMGITDVSHMGAVMAPAAADTLYRHLVNLKKQVDDYDLVLTGDLGCIGADIFKNYLKKTYNINLKNHIDAGCEIFLQNENTNSGGSGPVCLPLVLFNKILTNKKYKKILLIATGSLHSTTLTNQRNSIPAIAHAVSLEVL